MKLSIIIPTRERVKYLRHSVQTALAIPDPDIEIIVSDNESTDETEQVISAFDDERLKYVKTGNRVSMRANFENGLKHSTGEYIMFFGDDDGVMPNQIPILKSILQREKPDALSWSLVRYGWPVTGNAKTGGVRLTKSAIYGKPYEIDHVALRAELLNGDLKNENYFPALYHGVVSRRFLNSLTTPDGQFFNCTIPDIYFGYLALLKGGKFLHSEHPYTLNGYSPSSTGGGHKPGSKDNESQSSLAKFDAENAKDKNSDVATFGANVPAALFLAFETAKKVAEMEQAPTNYENWYRFVLQSTKKMTDEAKTNLINKLQLYANESDSATAFKNALENPKNISAVLLKVKRKFLENLAKRNSVRFSVENDGKNTIMTAVETCDTFLSKDLDAIIKSEMLTDEAWRRLKLRTN